MNTSTTQEYNISSSLTLEELMEKGEVSEILEWTFKYDDESKKDGLPYNISLFRSIGWVSYSEWKSQSIEPTVLIQKVTGTLSEWQEVYRRYLEALNWIDEKTQIQREWILYIIDTIEMAKIAVPIELEKASSKAILWDDERSDLVRRMDEYQTKIYGEKLSENLDEIHETLALMRYEWQHEWIYLKEDEKKEYLSIYTKLVHALERKYPDEQFEGSIEHIHYIDTKSDITKRMEQVSLDQSVYMKLWEMFIKANGLQQTVSTSSEVSSIYDGPTSLLVPSHKTYEKRNILEMFHLMVHEIGVHYINQKITEDAWFSFRWANNLEKEEWLAMLCEALFEWKSLEEAKRAWYSFPYILTAELLWKSERQMLSDLRVKMDRKWKVWDIYHNRDLRVMRGYPLDSLWAQRKDMSYGRGLLKIIHHIESGEFSLTDFFAGKFSIEDIVSWKIDRIIPRENRAFPLLFPEMLLYIFTHGRESFTHEKFWEYIKDKYGSVLRKEEVESISKVQQITTLKVFVNMLRVIEHYKNAPTPPHLPV